MSEFVLQINLKNHGTDTERINAECWLEIHKRSAMAKMDELRRNQVDLDYDAKKALYENIWELYE